MSKRELTDFLQDIGGAIALGMDEEMKGDRVFRSAIALDDFLSMGEE